MKQKHILLIRSGYPYKEFVLRRLKELGYFLIVMDSEINCPEGLVDDWIVADLYDQKGAVTAVEKYLEKPENYIDGAFTVWEEALFTTSALTDHFGWVGIPLSSVEKVKNKFEFRELCASYKLPTPKHHLLQSEEDFAEIEKNLTFPVVVKPVYGAASAFVVKVNSISDLRKAQQSIEKSIKDFWLAPEWKSIDLFVEEYISGQEVDIDILLQEGRCLFASVTDNFQTQEPFFVETGQALPSSLSQREQDDLIEMALLVLKSMGVENGCIHFEAKSSKNGPVPIEVNLRMGGDHVYEFIKEGWGICMIEAAAKIATGEPCHLTKPVKPHLHLQGRYFEPETGGTITDISYPVSLKEDPHVFKIHFDMKVGDKVQVPPAGFDFLGWITTQGKSTEEAKTSLDRLFPKITYKIENI